MYFTMYRKTNHFPAFLWRLSCWHTTRMCNWWCCCQQSRVQENNSPTSDCFWIWQFTMHNKVHIDGDSRISTVKATCICYVQTMDVDNPWIVLLKAWSRVCTDNLCIACSIRRSYEMKGTEHGFGQSSDTDICHLAGCLSEQELQAWSYPITYHCKIRPLFLR